jgi:hypothetical protein
MPRAPRPSLDDLAARLVSCGGDACAPAEPWIVEALADLRLTLTGHPSDPDRSSAIMRRPPNRNPDTEH